MEERAATPQRLTALSRYTPWQASPDHETSRAATYDVKFDYCVSFCKSISKIQHCIKYFAEDLSYISSFMKNVF